MTMTYRLAVVALVSVLTTSAAYAEDYFGLFLGGQFGGKGRNLEGQKDMNYKGTPDLHPASVSDILLSPSLTIGFKAGRYFETMPGFGVEVEGQYSRPDFKKQDVTIKLDQPYMGVSTISMNQDKAEFHMFTAGINLLYRFEQFETFKPYVGVGPALYVLKIKGSDYHYGTMNSKGFGVGFNAKAGVEIPITERLSFDTEYKFSYGKMDIDWFRSIDDPTMDYQAHHLTAGLRYKF